MRHSWLLITSLTSLTSLVALAGLVALTGLFAACETTGRDPARSPVNVAPIYASVCARCHGFDGRGGPPGLGGQAPRNFCDAAFQAARTDAELEEVIRKGKGTLMPSFATAFSPDEVKALARYVRSFSAQGK